MIAGNLAIVASAFFAPIPVLRLAPELPFQVRSRNQMRELFDEVAGKSGLDRRRRCAAPPARRAASASTSAPASPRRRAASPLRWTTGRSAPVRPKGVVPSREIADAVAAEWAAQQETHRAPDHAADALCNSVVEGVTDRVDAVAEDAANISSPISCSNRAGHPEALVAREAALWDPVLFWAADTLGAHFILAEGIVHVRQPDAAVAAPARRCLMIPGRSRRCM